MIPLDYFNALFVSLIIILYYIVSTFYPLQNNRKVGAVAYFILFYLWIWAITDGHITFIWRECLTITCGLLGAYCYILLSKKFDQEQKETQNTTDVSADKWIGVKGQILYVNSPSVGRHIGVLSDSDIHIEFTSNDQFEKYDYFQITGFENGTFIGEKITNL